MSAIYPFLESTNGTDFEKDKGEASEILAQQLKEQRLNLASDRKSDILTDEMLAQLGMAVHPSIRLREWDLIFGIKSDEASMDSFYHCTEKYNPTIILIQDSKKNVFGAFIKEKWHKSDKYYGSQEAFLFMFNVKLLFLIFIRNMAFLMYSKVLAQTSK